MIEEPVCLTFFELIFTTGFIKIMSFLWLPVIIVLVLFRTGNDLLKEIENVRSE